MTIEDWITPEVVLLTHTVTVNADSYDVDRLPRLATAGDSKDIAALTGDIRADSVPSIHLLADVEEWTRDHCVARGSSYVIEVDDQISGWIDVHDGWVNALYGRRGFYQREGFGEIELTAGSGNEEKTPDVLLEWLP